MTQVLVLNREAGSQQFMYRQGVVDRTATGDEYFVRLTARNGGLGLLSVVSIVDM